MKRIKPEVMISNLLGSDYFTLRIDRDVLGLLLKLQDVPKDSKERFLLERQVRDLLDDLQKQHANYFHALREFVNQTVRDLE